MDEFNLVQVHTNRLVLSLIRRTSSLIIPTIGLAKVLSKLSSDRFSALYAPLSPIRFCHSRSKITDMFVRMSVQERTSRNDGCV